ncbi:capsule biosynthesis protein [Loktanella sp. IMCC34160]|uniref:capsule biosynthesis protein n=1 Tax=Loktanella sp. IMCC34160 TaxID=2510646 RepID=UPI001F5D89E7|nr:capsule biosynthesis protein [Loktanella sp. IMCC34160]
MTSTAEDQPNPGEKAQNDPRAAERVALQEEMEELKLARLRSRVKGFRTEIEQEQEAMQKQAARAESAADAAQDPALAAVPTARFQRRHTVGIVAFVAIVILPVVLAAWYLTERATPAYTSQVGFSIRKEEVGSAFELLGGVAQLSGSSSSDTDILYDFIQSSEMVRKVDARVGLTDIWAKASPDSDPIFAYHPPGTIEDMTAYWQRMVDVHSDSGTGLINVEARAFAPGDAQAIATAIYEESSLMINRLSAIAREDATRYARDELDQSVERLKQAREALTRFRNENQIVDPAASIQSQMGLLSSLNTQLAETMIDIDMLSESTNQNDPRLVQARQRADIIRARIEEERGKLGLGSAAPQGAGEQVFADVVGEYERLAVELQFAEQSYTAALATYDGSVSEARRQSRYLAAHVAPTLPESPSHPQVVETTLIVALFAFLIWAFSLLVGYSLRDRR